MWTLRYPLSQLSHYPPIRQVTEELEGTATHLDSTLLTPFQSATPSRQLLGSSVKLALLLFSLLLPKHWVGARSYVMSFLANIRQKEEGGYHGFDRCPCVFLSLSRVCLCVCALLHSFSESQCLGLSVPWHCSQLLSPCLCFSVHSCHCSVLNRRETLLYLFGESKDWSKQNHLMLFVCFMILSCQPVSSKHIVNILTNELASILASQDPSCVLVFWPETVAQPDVQLVLALISLGLYTHWVLESVYTVHASLSLE